MAAAPAAGAACVAMTPEEPTACDPAGEAVAADGGGTTGTAGGAAGRPPAAISAGASRMPAGGDSFVFRSFASSSSISFSAFFTAALDCESGFSRR